MAEQNSNFEPQITAKFSRRLKKDEYIVWAGTSLDGYESSWIFSEKSLHLVFGLLVGIMTLVFSVPTMLVDGEINFVAVAIVAACALIVVNSFRKPKLKKAFFAVTNKRILTLIWGQLFQTALKDVILAELRQRTVYESGMLIEANDVLFVAEKHPGAVQKKEYIGGFSEEDAENVRRIIEEESAKSHTDL
ncbi:MAG: hypothetical protein IJZ61_03340 [Oscillospiraceae bacterium]|nr:hypothetical protein [Oscillospiraceae bacterium]